MSYIHILAQADAAPAAPVTTQSAEQPASTEATPQQEGGVFNMILPFLLIAVIFYFLLIRPQQKQQKAMKERQDSLKVGDKVVSAGGIHGIIREVQENAVKLEIAPNVIIKIAKQSIVQNIGKDGAPETK